MSADTTVVIAACRRFPDSSELSYTAEVVQAVENLFDDEFALEAAKAIFLSRPRIWFTGPGGFSRAKQFANLLAEETRANGILEYEERRVIEIGEDGVYELSRKGKRKPPVKWGRGLESMYGIESLDEIPDHAYHL